MDLLRYLIFENPLTLWIVLGMAAIACGLVWTRTGSRQARAAAVTLIAIAAAVAVLSWLVETDHERLIRTLDTMGKAAATGNADMFVERISPLYQSGSAGKEDLASVVRLGLQYVRAATETPTIVMTDGRATVTQACRFTPAPGLRMPLPPEAQRVVWEGQFAPDGDGEWRLRAAVALSPKRMAPEEAVRYLPRVK